MRMCSQEARTISGTAIELAKQDIKLSNKHESVSVLQFHRERQLIIPHLKSKSFIPPFASKHVLCKPPPQPPLKPPKSCRIWHASHAGTADKHIFSCLQSPNPVLLRPEKETCRCSLKSTASWRRVSIDMSSKNITPLKLFGTT